VLKCVDCAMMIGIFVLGVLETTVYATVLYINSRLCIRTATSRVRVPPVGEPSAAEEEGKGEGRGKKGKGGNALSRPVHQSSPIQSTPRFDAVMLS